MKLTKILKDEMNESLKESQENKAIGGNDEIPERKPGKHQQTMGKK